MKEEGLLGVVGFFSMGYAGYGIYDLVKSDIPHGTREIVEYVLSKGALTGFFAFTAVFCLGHLAAACHRKYASNNPEIEIEMEDIPEESITTNVVVSL